MILQWFSSQKKQTKILIVLALVALLIVLYFGAKSAYWKYQYFKGLEYQVKELAIENKQLKKDVDVIAIDRKRLQKTIDANAIEIDALTKQAKKLKNETVKIPPIVRTYPDHVLDSIMSNYRHLQRSEN